ADQIAFVIVAISAGHRGVGPDDEGGAGETIKRVVGEGLGLVEKLVLPLGQVAMIVPVVGVMLDDPPDAGRLDFPEVAVGGVGPGLANDVVGKALGGKDARSIGDDAFDFAEQGFL